MDRELPARIGSLVGVAVAGLRGEGTQHGLRHLTGTLADGRAVFVKAADDGGAPDAFAAEANGLRWLADAGGDGPGRARRGRAHAGHRAAAARQPDRAGGQ